MIRVLSLGAGVQSSTLAMMMAHGDVAPAQAAIFADVGAEPASVYRWLDWLEPRLPFPVHRVSGGDLRERVMSRVRREKTGSGGPPFFTAGKLGEGMLPRQCTRDHKLVPIERKLRELCGLVKGQRGPKEILAESCIGISYDEALRMKPSRLAFIRNVYPLVDMQMTRYHCLEWMSSHGYPQPPRSACTFCPYKSDAEWLRMKEQEPESFADAVAIDSAIRDGYIGNRAQLFVHRSCKPLASIDLHKQHDQANLFTNECEGMCGV